MENYLIITDSNTNTFSKLFWLTPQTPQSPILFTIGLNGRKYLQSYIAIWYKWVLGKFCEANII